MAGPERILVRGVNWLGDAVMTTPALQRLREAKPDARITLLTHEKLADLWRGHPSVDSVLAFADGESFWSVATRLRREHFDLALIFPNSPRSALESFLARIPQRIGYSRNGRGLLLTRAVPPRPGGAHMKKRSRGEIDRRIAANVPRETFPASAHHIHDYLHLVAAVGASAEPLLPLLRVGPEELAAFKRRFGLDDKRPLFGLNAGAEYGPAKRWPIGRFIDVATRLAAQTGCHWILFGGRADRALAAQLAVALTQALGADSLTNVTGEISLRELCAGLACCALVLTNDTGPMHLAVSLGTPVVVPFGSTSPELTGPPAGTRARVITGNVPCAPCFLRECPIDFRCMNSIAIEEVTGAALHLTRGMIPLTADNKRRTSDSQEPT